MKRAILAVSALLLTGCLSQSVAADGPTYDTVVALEAEADAVVVATVGELVGKEIDGGGEPEVDGEGEIVGIPMEFWSVDVERVLAGDAPDTLTVAWIDQRTIRIEGRLSEFSVGDELVLYLVHQPADATPGLKSVEDVWVPLSGDNGVMDIDGDKVIARSELLTGLTSPGKVGVPLTATVDELESALT